MNGLEISELKVRERNSDRLSRIVECDLSHPEPICRFRALRQWHRELLGELPVSEARGAEASVRRRLAGRRRRRPTAATRAPARSAAEWASDANMRSKAGSGSGVAKIRKCS